MDIIREEVVEPIEKEIKEEEKVKDEEKDNKSQENQKKISKTNVIFEISDYELHLPRMKKIQLSSPSLPKPPPSLALPSTPFIPSLSSLSHIFTSLLTTHPLTYVHP
jgi:hypothetical protein